MLNSPSIETEIRELLQLSSAHDIVAERLTQKYQEAELNIADLESLAIFFLKSGNAASLTQFCIRRLQNSLPLPWAHFAAGLYQLSDAIHIPLSKELKEALLEGAESMGGLEHLARCKDLDSTFQNFPAERAKRRREYQDEYQNKKNELLAQVEMLRTQELEVEEEQALLQLLRLFPKDVGLSEQHAELRERKAIRLLEAKLQSNDNTWDSSEQVLLEPEEKAALDIVLTSMHDVWSQNAFSEDMGHDFAMAMMMWDYPEAALDFLPEQSANPRVIWTRLEAQMLARHFLTLLDAIERVEKITAPDPESTFALLYIKAIAMWGLGHRFAAVEIMESIASHRPNYRSVMTLLHLWKGGES